MIKLNYVINSTTIVKNMLFYKPFSIKIIQKNNNIGILQFIKILYLPKYIFIIITC